MEKKYQVFISSTYTDLKEERGKIFQTLMELDCIPAGMELFPATDEEQFEFIKRIIDDCDYYLLIIGGRYGSVTKEGISFTEKEYDYAISKGLKVVAALHKDPEKIPLDKSEKDSEPRAQLARFREKASTGRLVKFWSSSEELPGIVALSMAKTIKMFPANGWIRANLGESIESSRELAKLSTENRELRKKVDDLLAAQLNRNKKIERWGILKNTKKTVQIVYQDGADWEEQDDTTLLNIFELIAPELIQENTTTHLTELLSFHLKNDENRNPRKEWAISINTIADWLSDMTVLDLIEPSKKKHPISDKNEYWHLTQYGKDFFKALKLHKLKIESRGDSADLDDTSEFIEPVLQEA